MKSLAIGLRKASALWLVISFTFSPVVCSASAPSYCEYLLNFVSVGESHEGVHFSPLAHLIAIPEGIGSIAEIPAFASKIQKFAGLKLLDPVFKTALAEMTAHLRNGGL